jgi:hypothetical protein
MRTWINSLIIYTVKGRPGLASLSAVQVPPPKAASVMSFRHESCLDVDTASNFRLILAPLSSCLSTIMDLYTSLVLMIFSSPLRRYMASFVCLCAFVEGKNGSAKRFILDCHEIWVAARGFQLEKHFWAKLMLFKTFSSAVEAPFALRISIIFLLTRPRESFKSAVLSHFSHIPARFVISSSDVVVFDCKSSQINVRNFFI